MTGITSEPLKCSCPDSRKSPTRCSRRGSRARLARSSPAAEAQRPVGKAELEALDQLASPRPRRSRYASASGLACSARGNTRSPARAAPDRSGIERRSEAASVGTRGELDRHRCCRRRMPDAAPSRKQLHGVAEPDPVRAHHPVDHRPAASAAEAVPEILRAHDERGLPSSCQGQRQASPCPER